MAVFSIAYLYPFVRMFCDAPDFGVFLNGADLINHGAVPSRDFVEPQGPGSFLWLAVFFRVFGATLGTARAVLDATGAGMALLAFYLSRRLGATGLFAMLFVLSMSVPLLPINSPHYDSNLFAFAALAVFLFGWDQELAGKESNVWLWVGTAVLCGVTSWMIQQKGLYLMVAMVTSLGWARRGKAWRPIRILAATYGALVMLPLVLFAVLRALPDVLFANYIWPLKKYDEVNAATYGFPIWRNLVSDWAQHAQAPMDRAQDIATTVPFVIVAGLPFLLPLAAKLAGKKWILTPMLPYWLVAYALWFSELHRLDMGHLRNGVMLMAVLFFTMCEACGRAALRRGGLILAMFVALTACTRLKASLDADPMVLTRRGWMQVKDNAALLQFLEDHTHLGEEVFVYPYQPIYYFVQGIKNPTRYSYLLYHLHTEDQFREATEDLERKKVRYVIFDTAFSGERFREVFPAYRQPEKWQLIMEPYLEAHYRMVEDLGRFHVLERVTLRSSSAR